MTQSFEQLAEQITEIKNLLNDTAATEESDDGLITAKVSGRGALLELEIDPRIYRNPDSTALAATITATVKAAAAKAQQRVFASARPFLADDARAEDADIEFDPFLNQLNRAYA